MNAIEITALMPQKVVIPYSDFPKLLNAFLARNQNTQSLEASGLALRSGKSLKWSALETFVKQVCSWGDYSGIAGRVLRRNSKKRIETSIKDAIAKLRSTPPNVVAALESVILIKELGVSFGSKHLRFLFPEYCPVLDSILSNRLSYGLSPTEYGAFCVACTSMADKLNSANVACPFPAVSAWRPSDVEAALYAWVNDWK